MILGVTTRIINHPRNRDDDKTKIRRVERITRYNNSTWHGSEERPRYASLTLENLLVSPTLPTYLAFFSLFLSSSSLVGGGGGVSGSSDRGRARCLLASSSNGLMGFETAQRDNPEFSFPTLFSQPYRDSPKADSGTLLSKLVSLLAIDCEKGEVSTCVSSAEGLPADRV